MTIFAQYFDGNSSAKTEVQLQFFENQSVQIRGEGLNINTNIDKLTFSNRVGNTTRNITLPNGSVFQSRDNDKIDKILKIYKNSFSFVHLLESRAKYALLALTMLVLSTIFFLTIGSTMAAKTVAYLLPEVIEKKIGEQTLDTIDKYILKKSTLDRQKQEKISKLFTTLTDNNPKYNLHFRKGVGINAFALPSGDIIITDELIEFSDGNMEMVYGILAHERGHVVYKHSMQMLIKASIMSAIVTYFTGDISALVTTMSTTLLTATYSREFEKEADMYAKTQMRQNGIDPKHLAEFFTKMEERYKTKDGEDSFFNSHPSHSQRRETLLAQ